MTFRSATRIGFGPTISITRLPVLTWMKVAGERRRLSQLDNEQLADLGLSRAEAAREAARPFWDLPSGR